ncbi:MAG: hypothetical protein GYA24_21570 [Candidatus Lokiarchaeota archaeon]|nr:hypothetical protein [Candidatus Lokiarchaeota archaeon]
MDMIIDKKQLKTVQQIDGTGIQTPHKGELNTIGDFVKELMPRIPDGDIRRVVEQEMGGSIDEIDFGETLTMSFEYFPGVRIHVVYFEPDDGEGDDMAADADVKFFFSGDNVTMVSSEDLASFADLTMDYLQDLVLGNHSPVPEAPSDLLQRAILQRIEPFSFLKRQDLPALAAFLGGKLSATNLEWQITKSYFPGITITLRHDGKQLSFDFSGANVDRINSHAKDELAIFMINHCLRFIGTTYTALQMPAIVNQAFSFSHLRGKS